MSLLNLLSFLLFSLGVVAYAIHELFNHGKLKWMKENASFWGKMSWLRKYDGYMGMPRNNWYYKTFKIAHKENFPGSATIFVTFTDGAHTMQFIFKLFLIASVVTYEPIFNMVWNFIIYFALWGITFTVTYKLLSK